MCDADFEKCKNAAIRLLGYSAKSGQDLYNRLVQKGYTEETAAKTLAEMTQYGYINDREFAERRAQGLMNKGMGARAIRWKLKQQGIADDIIEEVINEVMDKGDSDALSERLFVLARQYYDRGKGDHRAKLRYASDALWRKGYDDEAISAVMERMENGEWKVEN